MTARKPSVAIACQFLAEVTRLLAVQIVAAAGVGGHRAAEGGSQIFVERQVRGPGIPVPEGDVENADGAHDRASPAVQQRLLIHLRPQRLAVMRIAPDQHRCQQLPHRLGDQRACTVAAVAMPNSLEPIVGANLDQRIVPPRDLTTGKGRRAIERHAHGPRQDGSNLDHSRSLM